MILLIKEKNRDNSLFNTQLKIFLKKNYECDLKICLKVFNLKEM
jgi:hypothetical protein